MIGIFVHIGGMIRSVIVFIVFILILLFQIHTPAAYAQSCTVPTAPQNVAITYPNCSSTSCVFTEATCSWNAVSGASTYQLTVTEVDTSSIVKNQSVASSTTSVVFPVTQGKTYKCDVVATNSCGQSGSAGSVTLLCQIAGGAPTSAPTSAPAAPAVPQAQPTVPPTGMVENTMLISGIVLVFLLIGGSLIFL